MTADIMLPPTMLKDLVSPPDDVLNVHKGIGDTLQGEYTLLHRRIVRNEWQAMPVKALNASFPRHIDKMMEEVSCGLDTYFGLSDSFHKAPVFDIMSKVVARVGNRFTIGLPACMYIHSHCVPTTGFN